MRALFSRLSALAFCILFPALAIADEVQVAVAANFTAPMRELAEAFEASTGHRARLAYGSTGKFYAQISNGAPFEVLFSADSATPTRLAKEGKALGDSQFTYALGQLVLWSAREGYATDGEALLERGDFRHLAIATPTAAPYGAAALEVIRGMGLEADLKGKLVQGENITQAFQFVATGNAEVGFVALSQVYLDGEISRGSAWTVPAERYSPIRQDAVVLERGRDNPAAHALLDFMHTEQARAVMARYGYGVEP
ncbi:molybdate ABC transporter substrate-binding protein [Stutzerimonas azotifigens]|uniref:Molybdate ABC transporter substrate-binding protein n=1 Tax=Stutzerimonas azotifigens TaxID=291995 RepID=A0ABR5Z1E8_9GAMM|nr:molybdate ABC transporter substrate-binding protein [Stutzerimonas azotifigens]MBA1274017.1 molybdate ABC transporter substrate-binding protein [Stutzerimonas azotifigens]